MEAHRGRNAQPPAEAPGTFAWNSPKTQIDDTSETA